MKFTLFLSAAIAVPLSPLFVPTKDVIEGEYIVILKSQPGSSFMSINLDLHLSKVFGETFAPDARILHKYQNGYAATLVHSLLMKVRGMPEVDYVEANQIFRISETQQKPLNWGLDRISQENLPLNREYSYPDAAGEGVDVYVVDTGANIEHVEFEGRASRGLNTVEEDDQDGNGHGTHVASTIAGKTFGVAKKANIIAVKVLSSKGSGSTAGVLKGIEYVGTDHAEKCAVRQRCKSAANMSLGGGKSRAIDNAVDRVTDMGVLFAVAAGNEGAPACNSSPAASEKAITVGASNIRDQMSSFSNWGKCVDIFAPGEEITAAWIGSKHEIATISGTSMASPHVAGVLALLLSVETFTTADELKTRVLELSSPDKIRLGFISRFFTKNLLLNINGIGSTSKKIVFQN